MVQSRRTRGGLGRRALAEYAEMDRTPTCRLWIQLFIVSVHSSVEFPRMGGLPPTACSDSRSVGDTIASQGGINGMRYQECSDGPMYTANHQTNETYC